jgi:hypothetical protein
MIRANGSNGTCGARGSGLASRRALLIGVVGGLGAACAAFAGPHGGDGQSTGTTAAPRPVRVPMVELPAGHQESMLFHSGEIVDTEWTETWKPMCNSDLSGVTAADVLTWATNHMETFAKAGPDDIIVVDTTGEGGVSGAGINIVFNIGSGVPAAALPAFAAVEAYIESQFSDPITISINVSFQAMGAGILGGTSTYYTSTTYATARAGLVNGADANDVIQGYLPLGTTCPVRYNGSSGTITNEGTVYWTRANYNATVGTVTGLAANMTFNTQFSWDYDPSNGVSGYSFRDVLAHEVGHALGFVSRVDYGSSVTDMDALDLFRFQTTDGSADYNPDTYAEWQVRPRLVDYNNPNDSHHTDLVTVEYKMSDGSPYQASHFREQTPNIGIMDPALAAGETYYPNHYKASDLAVFDAIGYDR